jgi:D-alanine-D-alanine ligase
VLRYPLFAKPIAEGSSKGIEGNAKCSTAAELDRLCRHLLARYRQPVLVEEFLPGREVTVGILGTGERARAVGVEEVVMLEGAEPEVYSYKNKVDWEGKVQVRLATGPIVDEASRLALVTWRVLGARDCGRVDLRADATGRLQVLEVNPLPGLRPGYSDLALMWEFQGLEYGDLIRQIVESAMERVNGAPDGSRG